VNQSLYDSTAASRALNPQRFDYESYALTNCAITPNTLAAEMYLIITRVGFLPGKKGFYREEKIGKKLQMDRVT